jgi:hypothetical protein
VGDAAAAGTALADAGIQVGEERDVLIVEVENRPGTMGEAARRLANSGVNIELAYTTFSGVRVVLGVDDLDKARGGVEAALDRRRGRRFSSGCMPRSTAHTARPAARRSSVT